MRQPLWVINTSLLVIFLVAETVLFLLHASIPRRVSLEPGTISEPEKKSIMDDIDLKKIYGVSDLFGTYVAEVPVLVKESEFQIPPMPDIPSVIPLSIPVEKAPVFIAPLAVTLKGIVYLHDEQNKSMAIVQFNDSKQEHNYRIGDMIKDSQVLKIFPNRIIVVRANGQQETLYLREADAHKDLSYEEQKAVAAMKIIQKDGKYHIPLDIFVSQIHSLGQFVDMLDLTTVYQKGKSIGCRVGKATVNTLGGKLGFIQDDIITQVDSIPVTDLNSRVEVYDHVIGKKLGDSITVALERNNKIVRLTYVLSDEVQQQSTAKTVAPKAKETQLTSGALYDIEQQKKKILEQKVKLAPTAHQIQMDEQKKLLEARRKNILSNRYGAAKAGKDII